MRTITILFTLFIATSLFAQDEDLARVQKVNGIEAYILSEPLRDYEVVFGEGNKIQWGSFLTGGLTNESIAEKVAYFVKGVQKEAEKANVEFDAIVYTNGKNVSAIKFTDEATDDTDQIARVQRLKGLPVFIMSQPLLDYTMEEDKGPGIKWKSAVTGGLVNNSIEQDVEKYLKRFKKEIRKDEIEAIQYSSGKDAIGITFDAKDMATK